MWLSVDPMWEKYAGMSPYNYCVGNPVKLVDPDGRELQLFGDKKNIDLAVSHLQAKVGSGYALTMDERGFVSGAYTGEKVTRHQQRHINKLSQIISDKNIRVRLKTTSGYRTSSNRVLLGGAFMGNIVHGNQAVANQEVNPEVLDLVDEAFKKETGSMLFHEVTEAYIGAQISIEKGVSAKEADAFSGDNSIYKEAHRRASPQSGSLFFERYDKNGNFLYDGEGEAAYYNFMAKPTDINGGFNTVTIKEKITLDDIMR